MSWRIQGELWASHVQGWLAWDGTLTGSPEALSALDRAESFGTVGLTPVGPFIDADRTNETAAYVMGLRAFNDPDVSGDTPTLDIPPIPDGAVA